jgi:hypothetical protein
VPRELKNEEWVEWLQHPVTQLVRSYIKHRREDLKESWARGAYTAESEFGTKFLMAGALGEAAALQGFLDMDVDTVNGELRDE